MKEVTTHEAKTHLSRLLAEVEAGEEIVIRRGDLPVARLVPMRRAARDKPPGRPAVGTVTSKPIVITPGALDPLSDEGMAEWGL